MGKTIIKEDMFPEIIERYNSGGKAAAYDLIQSRYGLKNPYFIMRRIKKCRKYTYDPDIDQFTDVGVSASDSVFMDLNELCSTVVVKTQEPVDAVPDRRPAAMEKLVHELISDRLLILSRYIALDSSTRTILIDQTSLTSDGYQIITH